MEKISWTKEVLDEVIDKLNLGMTRQDVAKSMGLKYRTLTIALQRARRKPTIDSLREENRRLKEEVAALRELLK